MTDRVDLNSSSYWEERFETGDWISRQGRQQSIDFARTLVGVWGLPVDFAGTILDFGCALGDAIPVYREVRPQAQLIGIDRSEAAIETCRQTYGDLADFRVGDAQDVPEVDVIVASNVMEHIQDDISVVTALRRKCRVLLVIVPYREDPLMDEHLRSYDETYYQSLGPYRWRAYAREPFRLTWPIFFHRYLKNIPRLLLGRKLARRTKSILYEFGSHD